MTLKVFVHRHRDASRALTALTAKMDTYLKRRNTDPQHDTDQMTSRPKSDEEPNRNHTEHIVF